jgi:hypothetical protein
MIPSRYLSVVALALACLSCARFEESGLPGSASSMAQNQIMLIDAETQSLGHYRLTSLMRIHPDLRHFVAKHGTPDFLAETNNDRRHYFILYYLPTRQAYAARTRFADRGRLEFSGPYPVTKSEKVTLEALIPTKSR